MGLQRKNALAVKYLRLILCVTPEHVRTTGLEIPGGNQDHIAILDPDPPLHLASWQKLRNMISKTILLSLYESMVRQRTLEEKVVELYKAGLIPGLAHPYLGQEAIILVC